MAHASAPPNRPGSTLISPWGMLAAALGIGALGYALTYTESLSEPLRALFILVSTVLMGFALHARLVPVFRTKDERLDFDSMPWRIETAAMISIAGLICLANSGACGKIPSPIESAVEVIQTVPGTNKADSDKAPAVWLSGRMLFAALFILGLCSSVITLLPSVGRRIVISLIVIFHFAGMATAVTCVDPPNAQGPYLSKQLFNYVYRPYLSFLYLTNAYHFYSPDPGPPSLLWFAVHFDDGTYKWVKLPERANSPVGMHYQRMLALPEHTVVNNPRLPYNQAEYAYMGQKPPPRGTWEDIYRRREIGSTGFMLDDKPMPIPMVPDMDVTWQYREPADSHKTLIAKAAKRVCMITQPPATSPPGTKVSSVKAYRVTHQMLTPYEISQGGNAYDKKKHWPYFLGEFDPQGNLVDELEPYLYWYLPIAQVPKSYPNNDGSRPGFPTIRVRENPPADNFLLDCLEMHAARVVKKEKK